jgi:hypothetical protein
MQFPGSCRHPFTVQVRAILSGTLQNLRRRAPPGILITNHLSSGTTAQVLVRKYTNVISGSIRTKLPYTTHDICEMNVNTGWPGKGKVVQGPHNERVWRNGCKSPPYRGKADSFTFGGTFRIVGWVEP